MREKTQIRQIIGDSLLVPSSNHKTTDTAPSRLPSKTNSRWLTTTTSAMDGSLTITRLIFCLVLKTRDLDATTFIELAGFASTISRMPVVTGGIGSFGVGDSLEESASTGAMLPTINQPAKQNPIPAFFKIDFFIAPNHPEPH